MGENAAFAIQIKNFYHNKWSGKTAVGNLNMKRFGCKHVTLNKLSCDPKNNVTLSLVECHDRQRTLHEPCDNFFRSCGDFFRG